MSLFYYSPIDTIAERMLQWLPYLLEHLNTFINKFHSNSVALGPRVLMSCPVELSPAEIETWFINLWNHFVIPYLMGTIMAGIEVCVWGGRGGGGRKEMTKNLCVWELLYDSASTGG